MTLTSIRARRFIAAGAFAAAAIAAPIAVATLSAGPAQDAVAAPCLAWFGNKDDGVCLSYSNGNGITAGTPDVAWGSPGSGSPGFSTSPVLPGTTITQPIG